MISARDFLARHGCEPGTYELVRHPRTSRTESAAPLAHVRGRNLAVAHLVRHARGALALLVLPASERLDLEIARRVLGTDELRPASAADAERVFPGCDPDALPPFGARAGIPTVLDLCFFEAAENDPDAMIWFETGNHMELAGMSFEEFRKRAGPFTREACLHARPRLARLVHHGGRGALR